MQFDDIGIMQLVIPLDCLAVKNTLTPDPGEFQAVLEFLVNVPGEIKDAATDR